MESTDQSYVLGEWTVRAGSEEEFVQRWNTIIEWSMENAPGAGSFVLVRSTEDPTRFLSFGSWESQQAQQAWREMPRHQELLDRCRELCEAFDSHPYALASSPSAHGGPVSALTDKVGGMTDNLLGGGEQKRR